MVNSHSNRVRLNTFYGNGSATSKDSATASNSNNFGLGLFGASQFNLIEKNKIGGNINGLYLGGGGKVTGNIISRNAILGNPSAEAIREFGPSIGADIQDFSPGANTFEDNRCLVYSPSSPQSTNPCVSKPDDDGDWQDRNIAAFGRNRLAFPQARLVNAVFHPSGRLLPKTVGSANPAKPLPPIPSL